MIVAVEVILFSLQLEYAVLFEVFERATYIVGCALFTEKQLERVD
jgi:hypothetical protein